MIRESTSAEYNFVCSLSGLERKQMDTARTTTIEWRLMGKLVAQKLVILRRGKIASASFMVDPVYGYGVEVESMV